MLLCPTSNRYHSSSFVKTSAPGGSHGPGRPFWLIFCKLLVRRVVVQLFDICLNKIAVPRCRLSENSAPLPPCRVALAFYAWHLYGSLILCNNVQQH